MGAYREIAGARFGRLVALERVPSEKKEHMWLCVCDCGNKKIFGKSWITGGNTKSCGCLMREVSAAKVTKHGHNKRSDISSTYHSWSGMRARCKNPKNKAYSYYGGRGIRVCERWDSFENFLADMGEKPKGTSLDRYPNNDGNYEPSNCRWATFKQQRVNQRIVSTSVPLTAK